MPKNIYVGNLNYDTTEATLRELFGEHGQVVSVNVIMDQYSGRSKGFAFVEMDSEQSANAAIAALNGKEVDGRALKIAEARPRGAGGGMGGEGRMGGGDRGGRGGMGGGERGGDRFGGRGGDRGGRGGDRFGGRR